MVRESFAHMWKLSICKRFIAFSKPSHGHKNGQGECDNKKASNSHLKETGNAVIMRHKEIRYLKITSKWTKKATLCL